MSVTVEFEVDAREAEQCSKFDLRASDPVLFLHTLLIFPIRWSVGGTELLDGRTVDPRRTSPTLDLPLFNVDRLAPASVRKAEETGNGDYDLPGSGEKIRLVRIGREIEASSPFARKPGVASVGAFRAAFLEFHRQVVRFAREHVKGAENHPWLREPW